ncbi:hypothetical protein K438DRAFT_1766397 [Mycena galopus ATCC 62051]|nr:hypothetical protein K438DRAFT_1766397 [Mycena galopus ATCC 62051]
MGINAIVKPAGHAPHRSIFPSCLGRSRRHSALENARVALASSAQGHLLPQNKATYLIPSVIRSCPSYPCSHPAVESASIALTASTQGHLLPQNKSESPPPPHLDLRDTPANHDPHAPTHITAVQRLLAAGADHTRNTAFALHSQTAGKNLVANIDPLLITSAKTSLTAASANVSPTTPSPGPKENSTHIESRNESHTNIGRPSLLRLRGTITASRRRCLRRGVHMLDVGCGVGRPAAQLATPAQAARNPIHPPAAPHRDPRGLSRRRAHTTLPHAATLRAPLGLIHHRPSPQRLSALLHRDAWALSCGVSPTLVLPSNGRHPTSIPPNLLADLANAPLLRAVPCMGRVHAREPASCIPRRLLEAFTLVGEVPYRCGRSPAHFPATSSLRGPPHIAKGSGSVYPLLVLGAGEPQAPAAPLALLTPASLLVRFALPFVFGRIGAEIACHWWMLQTYGPNLGTRRAVSPPPTAVQIHRYQASRRILLHARRMRSGWGGKRPADGQTLRREYRECRGACADELEGRDACVWAPGRGVRGWGRAAVVRRGEEVEGREVSGGGGVTGHQLLDQVPSLAPKFYRLLRAFKSRINTHFLELLGEKLSVLTKRLKIQKIESLKSGFMRLPDFRGRSRLENSWLAPLDILQDGHSMFPSMKAVLNEFLELYFLCASSTNPQSRILEVQGFTGAGMGCASILLHDNRWLSSFLIQWRRLWPATRTARRNRGVDIEAAKGQEEGASKRGTLVEMWCEEETPCDLRILTTVWASLLSDEIKWRFYKNWYCSTKKAFTRYAKKHAEDNGKSVALKLERIPKEGAPHGDPGGSIPNEVEFAQGLFEKLIEVDLVFEQDEYGYHRMELSKEICRIGSGIDDANALTESDVPKRWLSPLRDLEQAQLKFIDTSSKLMLRTFAEVDFLGVLKAMDCITCLCYMHPYLCRPAIWDEYAYFGTCALQQAKSIT